MLIQGNRLICMLKEASLFMGWGMGNNGKGGVRTKSDDAKRGGDKFWTTPEGGRKILDFPRRGGAKNFRLDQFFQCSQNMIFSCFGVFWALFIFHFLVLGGATNFGQVPKGGRKILDFPRRGGRKILDLMIFFFNVHKTQFFPVF